MILDGNCELLDTITIRIDDLRVNLRLGASHLNKCMARGDESSAQGHALFVYEIHSRVLVGHAAMMRRTVGFETHFEVLMIQARRC
jgi:hypothetical protein